MARAFLKPQVRGTLSHSTGNHRNHNVQIVPEIESENWEREQAETGGNYASDRKHETFDRMMRGNRGVL